MDKEAITIVFYHANCVDGMTASAIVDYFYDENELQRPRFIACRYGEPLNICCKGETVLTVDFSFNVETTTRLIEETEGRFLTIDHHETAKNNLDQIEDKYKIFDMNNCGTVLTWKYLFPVRKIPEFLLYVDDYDLWRKDSSRKWKEMNFFINYLIADSENKIVTIKEILDESIKDKSAIKKFVKCGTNHLECISSMVDRQINGVHMGIAEDPLEDNKQIVVAIANVTNLLNEISERIMELTPTIDLVLTYRVGLDGTFTYSARSSKYPANLFAEKFGGGGHKNASGFKTKTPIKLLYSTYYNKFIKGKKSLFIGKEYDIYSKYFQVERGQMVKMTKDEYKSKTKDYMFVYTRNIYNQIGDTILCHIDSEKYIRHTIVSMTDTEIICEDNSL